MHTTRLEAFSDGVIAILITIMVLEFKVPHETTLAALFELRTVFCSYVLSFIFLGIYWNNHHHMFHATERVSGGVLWANLHLLFWLSLVPFVTSWMGESFTALPTAAYGVVLLFSGIAYTILVKTITSYQGANDMLSEAIGNDGKGKLSILLYALAIPAAFIHPAAAATIYVIVALMWLIPDRRIESRVQS